MPEREILVQIRAPHFTAGVLVLSGGNYCAPIVKYMARWSLPAIRDYCARKGWTCEVVNERKANAVSN